ncbi:GtrA family protein [Saccharothrix violaceirubra]|uniref:GtrA family protein n=1 Tax=Saccharothrix violaceirubra TaxID=413306 RepID=UPI0016169F4C|nr:GtrA family protein [Saccharothrix violaceirubra]
MSVARRLLGLLPEPLRFLVRKHRELIRFAVVGGTTFVIDNGVWYALKLTILQDKVVTAKFIAVLVAVIASYVLSREWSFHTRGGRERHHEAALFFLVSGLGIGVNLLPLVVSRHVLDLHAEIADFVSGSVIGMLLATAFKFWAMRRFVFPQADARPDTRTKVVPLVTKQRDVA